MAEESDEVPASQVPQEVVDTRKEDTGAHSYGVREDGKDVSALPSESITAAQPMLSHRKNDGVHPRYGAGSVPNRSGGRPH